MSASSRNLEARSQPAEWVAGFVDDIPTGAAVFDRELRYVAANALWLEMFGLAPRILAGQRHDEIAQPAGAQFAELQRRALAGEVVEAPESGDGGAADGVGRRSLSLRPRRGRDGAIVGVIALVNATAAGAGETAAQDADPLTGIAGRHRFLDRLHSALAADPPPRGTAVFLLDIGNFSGINDLYGTRIGDRVLAAVAARLKAGVRGRAAPAAASREPDLVARLGADEFGIVLGNAEPSPADAEAFAQRLLGLVAMPVVVDQYRIRLTGNVGFLITGAAHRTEDDVLRDLNAALQEAKACGPNGAKAWEPRLTKSIGRRLALLDQLRRAHDEGEFVLHYQPILSLGDGRVAGAEALLRWNHPRDGLVAPGEFLPLLEESGLIVPVGCWVIREAVRQMQVWQMLYGRTMLDWVSINVSARQFDDPALLMATLTGIDDAGVPLARLKLEITESAVMRNPEVTRAVLAQLQNRGIRIALDDFGTGYSALGALRHYPVDTIKIDRDFTARLDTMDGRELMLALLKIARIYGASVVTEGVETQAQHDLLCEAGCDFGQGYLFAKPMDGSFFGAYALTHLVRKVAIG